MTILDKILPGSFKGVSFLMVSGTVSGGPKAIIHKYPNQDTQTVEVLGKNPRTYAISILIGGGVNYLNTRDNILRVLEDTSTGKLVHPLYGDIENVIALPYTLNESFNTLGEGRIEVVFEVSEGTGVPERITDTIETIEAAHVSLLSIIGSGFVSGYGIQTNQPATYTDAVEKGEDVVSAFNKNAKTVQGATDRIDEYTKNVSRLQNDITAIINAPLEFSNSVQRLYTALSNLYPTTEAVVIVIEKFFNFGDDDNVFKLNTPSRITRTKNRNAVNVMMQTTALSYSYFYSAQSEYVTATDIAAREAALESQYKKVVSLEGVSIGTKDELTQLRVNIKQFFEAEKLTAQQIITIQTPLTSDRLLAFQYYGDSTDGEKITELNKNTEPSFVEGSVLILTE